MSNLCNPFDFFPEKQNNDGGTSDTYTNLMPTPITIGGIEEGSTFNEKSMQEMWDELLYPYIAPSFSSFSISGQVSPIEVGNSVLANRTFNWSTTYPDNINPNSITIRDVTNAVDLVTDLTNTGSYISSISAIVKVTNTSHIFRIIGTNSQSVNFQRDYSISWQWQRYYGESILTSLTENDIKSLRVNGLSNNIIGDYIFNTGGYKYFCFPTTLGIPNRFYDPSTNFDLAMESPIVISITNSYSINQNYNVWRTTNILNSGITIRVT